MSNRIPFIVTWTPDSKPQTITLFLDGKQHVMNNSAPLFNALFEALKANDVTGIRRSLEVKKSIAEFEGGKFKLYDNDTLYYNGAEVRHCMVERILAMYKAGVDASPMMRFLENLLTNPSQDSQNELYLFLEHNNLPITDDGHFLAYKYVTSDYKDCYSQTLDYRVGNTIEMPRSEVDANRHNTCSRGLHFCSREYIGDMSYGGRRLMVIKINPRDVVSIPSDYNNSKGRCCKYYFLEEIKWKDYIVDGYRPTSAPDSVTPAGPVANAFDSHIAEIDEEIATLEAEVKPLSDDDVRNIRKACKTMEKTGLTYTAIGKLYNRHRSTIQRIADFESHMNVK